MDSEQWITELEQRMSLEERIGQLILVGFDGTDVSDETAEFLSDLKPGGIILFSRNVDSPDQVRRLTERIQELAPGWSAGIPALISIDQEGGSIARLTGGFTVFPGNMALGAARSPEICYEAARCSGEELKSVGINMNLAPVADVNNNPLNPVIGVRSFGEDPVLVSELAAAAVRGYQDAGVIATAKHFPGHGDTSVDSHLAMPEVPHGRRHLEEVELMPFRAAIGVGVKAIMTAHVAFPAIELDRSIPATLSYRALTRLLRDELGFNGLIVSDCMEMKAISDHFSPAEAAARSIEAGADLILVSHTPARQKESVAGLIKAVETGRISEARIGRSVRRILSAKAWLGLLGGRDAAAKPKTPPVPVSPPASASVLRSPQHLRTADKAARASLTLLQNNGVIPIPAGQERIGVIELSPPVAENQAPGDPCAPGESGASGEPAVFESLGFLIRQRADQTVVVDCPTRPSQSDIDGTIESLSQSGCTLAIVTTHDAHRIPEQVSLVNALVQRGLRVIVVGMGTPYEFSVLNGIDAYICCYSYREASIKATAGALFGDFEPTGRLPVSVNSQMPFGFRLERLP